MCDDSSDKKARTEIRVVLVDRRRMEHHAGDQRNVQQQETRDM